MGKFEDTSAWARPGNEISFFDPARAVTRRKQKGKGDVMPAFEVPMENIESRLATGKDVPFLVLGPGRIIKVSVDIREGVVIICAPFDQFRVEVKGKDGTAVAVTTTRRIFGSSGSHNTVKIPIERLSQALKNGADTLRVEEITSPEV